MEQETKLTPEQEAIYNVIYEIGYYIEMRRHFLTITASYLEGEEIDKREGEIAGLDWVLELLNTIGSSHNIPIK